MPGTYDFTEWQRLSSEFNHRCHAIQYWDQGEGDALLLIHGFPTASWDWHAVWGDLASKYRLIALDMIGFGFSAKPRDYHYSIFDQADIQESLCKELGVSRVSIITHDYGNTVTQELLVRNNERVAVGRSGLQIERICYLNGGLFPESHRPLPIQRLLLGPLGGLVSRLMNRKRFEANIRAIFGPHTPPSRHELDHFWSLIQFNNQRAITHKLAKYQLERRRHRERWVGAMSESNTSQRFIVGMVDPISGANMAARYREIMPEPDIVELDEIGHWPQLESPKAVLNAIYEFIA